MGLDWRYKGAGMGQVRGGGLGGWGSRWGWGGGLGWRSRGAGVEV